MLISALCRTASAARPGRRQGCAGGKTGTAQTGQFTAEGQELLNYWFSGFWPEDSPQFTVTVLQDAILEPEISSAAIFARVRRRAVRVQRKFYARNRHRNAGNSV